jgi:hypothetical protein
MHVHRTFSFPGCAVALLALLFLFPFHSAHAQGRINDKDMEHLMKNLHEDTKDFRSAFDAALHKSSARNTSQEKDARYLSENFEKQAEDLAKHFKDSRTADNYVAEIVNAASHIDRLVYSLNLDSKATLSWEKVRSELHQIANAYGVNEPYIQGGAGAYPR